MSENFFKSLYKGNFITPPDAVISSFRKKFLEAINVEWVKIDYIYEAIFYDNEIEKIAKFLENGNWIETRTNLDIHALEQNIRKNASLAGEIMNAIEIETIDNIKYEIIVRDKQLNRYLLMLSSTGEIKSNNPIN